MLLTLQKKLKLGIIIKNYKVINHRSLIKVLFNPFLRFIGYEIATFCYESSTLCSNFDKKQILGKCLI